MTLGYTSRMTKQIAVKLPDELIGELDRLVAGGTFETRSHAVRAGVEAILSARRRADVERRYRDSVARRPETERELAQATRLAMEAIRDEPWERWW